MASPLSRSELRTWVTLIGGIASFLGALDRQLRGDYGISHDDYRVLATLSRAAGKRARMSEMATTLTFSPSRLTHAIRRFESAGWVKRTTTSGDRRGVDVELTEDGLRWVNEVSAGHLSTVQVLLFETLGSEGARELAESMRTVGQAARDG